MYHFICVMMLFYICKSIVYEVFKDLLYNGRSNNQLIYNMRARNYEGKYF